MKRRSARWRLKWINLGVCWMAMTCAAPAEILTTPEFEISPRLPAVRNEANWYAESAWNNGRWLIAWSYSSLDPFESVEARAAVVAADGTLLTPFAVGLSIEQKYPWRIDEVDVAPLGEGFLVVWTMIDTHGENYIAMVQAVRVNRDGVALDIPATLSPGGSLTRFPQLASAGDRCLVAWMDDIQHDGTIELRGCVVDSEGPLENLVVRDLSPPGLAQDQASLAYAGGKFLAVWTSLPESGPGGIHGAFVNLDGLAGPAFAIAASGFENDASVSPLGDGFVVVWSDFWRDFGPGIGEFGEIKATRINTSGQSLDSPPIEVRPNPNNESVLFTEVAGDAESALIAWTETDETNASSVVRVRRMQPDGTISPLPGGIIAEDDDHQIFNSALAPGTAGWLYAHTVTAPEPVGGRWPSQIFARTLNEDGTPDGAPFAISHAANEMQAVSVAAKEDGFVAVWQDDRNAATGRWNVQAQNFLPNGTPDGEVAVIAASEENEISPVVAIGDGMAVAWTLREEIEIPDGMVVHTSVWATVIHPTTPFPPTRLSAAEAIARAPAITFADGRFFVVWRQFEASTGHDIYGVPLPMGGQPLQPAFAICNHADRQTAPAVAGTNSGFLVAWRDGREQNGRDAVYASFLPGGAPPANTDGFAIAPGSGDEQYAPEIAARGDRFLVVWREALGGPDDPGRVAAVRVNNLGAPMDAFPLYLAAGPSLPFAGNPVREPAVSEFDGGWVLGWHQDVRIFAARVLDESPLRSGDPFPVTGPADFQTDTLSIATLDDSVMFGFVRDPDQVFGAITFPNERVPDLQLIDDGSGRLTLSVPAHAYFVLTPDLTEVSSNAQSWQPLSESGLPWSPGANGTILITPSSPGSFMVRLRASFAAP